MNDLLMRRRLMISRAETEPVYLYNSGDECEAISGGWAGTLSNAANKGTLAKESTYIRLSNASTSSYSYYRQVSVVTQSAVDTTGKSTLNFEFSSGTTSDKSTLYIALYNSSSTACNSWEVETDGRAVTADEPQTMTLDISSYQGLYYVGAVWRKAAGSSSTFQANIYNVWME